MDGKGTLYGQVGLILDKVADLSSWLGSTARPAASYRVDLASIYDPDCRVHGVDYDIDLRII